MADEKDYTQEEEQELAQPYDTTFKDWIRQNRTATIGVREKAAIRKELKVYDPL